MYIVIYVYMYILSWIFSLKKKKPYQFSGSMYESNKRLSWFHL